MKKLASWLIVVVLLQIILINVAVTAIFLKAGAKDLLPWNKKDPMQMKPGVVREMVLSPIKKSERMVRKLENNNIIDVMKNIFVTKPENRDAFRIAD